MQPEQASTIPPSESQATGRSRSSVLGLRRRFRVLTGNKAAKEEAKSYLQFTHALVLEWPSRLNEALIQFKPDEPLSLLMTIIDMHKVTVDGRKIVSSDRPTSGAEPRGVDDWTKVVPMLEHSIREEVARINKKLKNYREVVESELGEKIQPHAANKSPEIVVSPNLLKKFIDVSWRSDLFKAQISCMKEMDSLLVELRRLASMRLLVWTMHKSEGANNTWKGSHDKRQGLPEQTLDVWELDRQSLVDKYLKLYPSDKGDSLANQECRNVAD